MSSSLKDFNKALEIGRPPNIAKLFPNSRALLVSGKLIDRAMIANTVERIARVRATAEAKEGVAAFLAKRRAAWVPRGE